MKLFVGLGNPGDKYSGNRHNIGFMAVDRIAEAHGFSPWRKKFQSLVADGDIDGARITLLKPQTYMNESGQAVGEAMRFLKLEPEDVYVFHDELDLAPGKIKVKTGGGNAGHNGLRSVSAHIGNAYPRVRLGIGHPGTKDAVVPYVLNDFAKSERAWLEALLGAIATASGYLAKGNDARFLSDVALATRGDTEAPDTKARDAKTSDTKAQETKARAAEPRASSTQASAKPHPAGERAGKRQSALAENLKKWLGNRKPSE